MNSMHSTIRAQVSYTRMRDAGIRFLETPRSEPYGKVAVWQDPFGNKWDLLESR